MYSNSFILIVLGMAVFIAAVFMHIARKNSSLISAYTFQSIAISLMLLFVGFNIGSMGLMITAAFTLLVKAIGAPRFLSRFIGKEQLNISTNSYLSLPITLVIILGLTILVKSYVFMPLVTILPGTSEGITLAISGIFVSLFLAINRRGVFPQLTGILSFENEMVAFGLLAGVEQSLVIEMGILFDILLWIIIASVLITLVFSHFGSLTTTEMNKLKD
jgi:hydrogenase-4 membrane subunit HyfE